MRTKKYILEHFSEQFLEQYQQKLASTNKETQLSTAMKILHVEENKFDCLPFQKDRFAFLQYKYWLTFFELFPANYPQDWQENIVKFRALIEESKSIIEDALKNTADEYSPFAQGLSTLFRHRGKHAPIQDELLASVVIVGQKQSGIEPGFIAAHHFDLIEFLLREFAAEEILAQITEVSADIEQLFLRHADHLPKYMYKMDYRSDAKTITMRGATPVYLTEEDVKRTNTVQEAYKRGTFIGDLVAKGYVIAKESLSGRINRDAILETLSNDLASIFMRVQEQKLYLSDYANGDKKFMPCSRWVDGASEFAGKKLPLVDGYLARKLLVSPSGIAYYSDDRVANLTRHYIPLLATGDYDKVGSQGQNLLKIPAHQNEFTGKQIWHLIGIDFGHTFRENSRILKTLSVDGRFEQPKSNPFSNFSALSDGTLREKMEGVLIIAKIVGRKVAKTVIDSYGDEFHNIYDKIQPNEAENLCRNYQDAMDKLAHLDFDNHQVYMVLKKDIADFQKIVVQDLNQLLDLFDNYLGLDASLINFIDNLNNFSAGCLGKTTLLSENKQLYLQHMRIKVDHKVLWTARYNPLTHCYTLEYSHNDQTILDNILKIFKQQGIANRCSLQLENAGINLVFHESDRTLLTNNFNELVVQEAIHPEEFAAIEHAKAELVLQDLVQAPWFKAQGMQIDLWAHQAAYRLLVQSDRDDLIALMLNKLDMEFNHSGALELSFSVERLSSIIHQLSMISHEFIAAQKKAIAQAIPTTKINLSLSLFAPPPESLQSMPQSSIADLLEQSEYLLIDEKQSATDILIGYYDQHLIDKTNRNDGDSTEHWCLRLATTMADTYNYYTNPLASISFAATLKECLYPSTGTSVDLNRLYALLQERKTYIEKQLSPSTYDKELELLSNALAETELSTSMNLKC